MFSHTFNQEKQFLKMIRQNAHGLFKSINHIKWPCLAKLAILIWLINLFIMPINLPTYYLFTYLLNIYLSTYLFINPFIYLLTYLFMEKKFKCYIHWQKKFIEVLGNMLNAFGITMFYKMVWWPKHWCGINYKVQCPLSTYIMWSMHIHIYIYIHVCKCIIFRWVVYK
jgi:hypothetical protein